MSSLCTGKIWGSITKAAISAKMPSYAAVAYFGSKGDKLLPLRDGSKIVVDASIAAVSAGVTDPRSLRRLHDNGVEVYTMPLLHAKVFAFDNVGFVGSTNVSENSANRLIEAAVSTDDAKTLKSFRVFVTNLCTDRIDNEAFDWLESNYKPPKPPLPSVTVKVFRRLLTEIMASDQQGYSGHQVQPSLGAWSSFFGIHRDDITFPVFRLRNLDNGSVINRKVVPHTNVITLDIPESAPGAILEMFEVGHNRYDYRVVNPGEKRFSSLENDLKTTYNPMQKTGRLWNVS